MTATATAAVLERLRSVVRLAEHAGTPKAEAEAAWNRARIMCEKYGLDLNRYKTQPAGGARPGSSGRPSAGAWSNEAEDIFGSDAFREWARGRRGARESGFDPFGDFGGFHPGRTGRKEENADFGASAAAMRERQERDRRARQERERREQEERHRAERAREDGADADYWEELAARRERETRKVAQRKLERAARFLGAVPGTHVGDQTGQWIIPGLGRWGTAADVLTQAQRRGLTDQWIDPQPLAFALATKFAAKMGAVRSSTTMLPDRWFYNGTAYTDEQLIVIGLDRGVKV